MGAGGTGSSVSRRSSLSPLTSASWVTSKAGGRYEMLWHMMRQASPLGTRELVLFALLVKAYALVYTFSRVHHYTLWKFFAKLLWKNAATRPPVLIVLILLGWSWVVRTCTAAGMELELVLGGPTKPSSMAVSCALVLTNIFLSVHLVHLLASEVPGLTWRPWLTTNVLLHAVLALVIAAPHKWLHADARTSLLRAAWDSLIAPFAPVSFWHVIVADYATSLAKAFADVQLLFCEAHAIASLPEQPGAPYTRTTVLWEQMHPACVDSPFNPALLALPFWVRLCQCLHVYAHTKEQKNLWNALKYSTAFPLIYLGWHRRVYPSPFASRLFVLAAVLNSSYTFVWDVLMDWGMLRWDKERSCWSLTMREQTIISARKATYALLAAFNLSLRFLWAMAVFGAVPTRGHGMFFFEAMEIARRTVWAAFRIEWEYVAKVLPKASATYAAVDKDSIDGEDASLLPVHDVERALDRGPKGAATAGARALRPLGTDVDL
ncbi:hypothetical protein KFE25_008872 [Diacronema lutheri]|uniref:EXS domain-containing protein n=2 Tax=Diacronema lutheri TaxID=2081491 RepID=A0A8J6CGT2_DIALT|nr:hypothetical protein KFE25_008872 [Diacronema lutheri]